MDPLEKFSDLDYPGRKPPVNRGQKQASSDSELWDAKPIKYRIGKEEREFFFISALCKALGYSHQSIRAWEAAGLLPRTPFRSPRPRTPTGVSAKGRRLWTREQIEAIVRIAKKHGVIFPQGKKGEKKPPTPAFAAEVARAFHALVNNPD